MEFIGRLAALVPKPRVNLTRFHGKNKAYSMTWAQRLKRVFAIEIEKCEKCGGCVKIIACIEDAEVIEKILKHLGLDEASQTRNRSPPEGLSQHLTQLF